MFFSKTIKIHGSRLYHVQWVPFIQLYNNKNRQLTWIQLYNNKNRQLTWIEDIFIVLYDIKVEIKWIHSQLT
jgi:hypothetical protein